MVTETVFHTIARQNMSPALAFVKSKGMNPRNHDELVADLGKIYLEGIPTDLEYLATLHPHTAFIEEGLGSTSHIRHAGHHPHLPGHRGHGGHAGHAGHGGHHNASGYSSCTGCGGSCMHNADGAAPAPAPAPLAKPDHGPMIHHTQNIMSTGLFIVAIIGLLALVSMKGEKHRPA